MNYYSSRRVYNTEPTYRYYAPTIFQKTKPLKFFERSPYHKLSSCQIQQQSINREDPYFQNNEPQSSITSNRPSSYLLPSNHDISVYSGGFHFTPIYLNEKNNKRSKESLFYFLFHSHDYNSFLRSS